MDWTILGTIIAAFGGLEFIKWLFNRKAYARRENATALDAEINTYEKQIDRYEDRLASRDAKVDALYIELRKEQEEKIALLHENDQLKINIEVLKLQKCEVRGCSNRKPPGEY